MSALDVALDLTAAFDVCSVSGGRAVVALASDYVTACAVVIGLDLCAVLYIGFVLLGSTISCSLAACYVSLLFAAAYTAAFFDGILICRRGFVSAAVNHIPELSAFPVCMAFACLAVSESKHSASCLVYTGTKIGDKLHFLSRSQRSHTIGKGNIRNIHQCVDIILRCVAGVSGSPCSTADVKSHCGVIRHSVDNISARR